MSARSLLLQIDLGDERRQLVAGIRAHYAPGALVVLLRPEAVIAPGAAVR